MRTAVTLAVGLAVALVCVAIAAADADVSADRRALTVKVRAVAGPDGNHGLIIEGFQEQDGRDGWRVRQDRLGRPAIVDADPGNCDGNVFFNDVVCSPFLFFDRQAVGVTGGDGDDQVVLSEFAGGRETGTIAVEIQFAITHTVSLPNPAGCPPDPTRNEGTASVDLGAGADFLAVVEATQRCSASFLARLNAHGGAGNDIMLGGPLVDELFGDGDFDQLGGAGGNDTLDGGAGPDFLFGDEGVETLRGGAEGDRLFARDGGFDSISCGPGVDSVEGDLADFFVPKSKTGVPPGFTKVRNNNATDCESIDATPFDDGPPGHAVGRTLKRTSNGTGTITVACPRDARVSCRGTLTVRLGRAYGPVVGRGRYTAPRGKQTAVRVALGSARPGASVFVHTVEQGVSKKGPRYSQRLLLVR